MKANSAQRIRINYVPVKPIDTRAFRSFNPDLFREIYLSRFYLLDDGTSLSGPNTDLKRLASQLGFGELFK